MTKIAKKLAILLVLITIALISFNQVKAVDLNLTENTSSSNSTLSSDDEDDEEEDNSYTTTNSSRSSTSSSSTFAGLDES